MIAALFSKWWAKVAAILAAAAVIVTGVLAIYLKGRSAGSAETRAKVNEKAARVRKRMNDANVKAPRTVDDALKRLEAGDA